ncbi:MAG: response regulator transcription factor [Acidimicrobiales bacterium]
MEQILVVEDDAAVRGMLVEALSGEGAAVKAVEDGQGAIALLQSNPPDLMVLDLMMPAMDGFTVLRQRRQLGLAPGLRVMVLSARTGERDFMRCYSLGADDYLTKPFEIDELISRAQRLLSMSNDLLAARREEELRRSELLDRLELAFSRPRH